MSSVNFHQISKVYIKLERTQHRCQKYRWTTLMWAWEQDKHSISIRRHWTTFEKQFWGSKDNRPKWELSIVVFEDYAVPFCGLRCSILRTVLFHLQQHLQMSPLFAGWSRSWSGTDSGFHPSPLGAMILLFGHWMELCIIEHRKNQYPHEFL